MQSKYEVKDGEGSLFRNDRKRAETDPDYNGSARLNGTDFVINGWKKTAKSGVAYLKLSLRRKGENRNGARHTEHRDFNDDPGF